MVKKFLLFPITGQTLRCLCSILVYKNSSTEQLSGDNLRLHNLDVPPIYKKFFKFSIIKADLIWINMILWRFC